MGSDIDLSLKNIWRSWFAFKKGKRHTGEFYEFEFQLENNLLALHSELNGGVYRHGGYRRFTVFEHKKREISVAGMRDRVVHCLIYDYLVNVFDKTFIYDAWSCRKGKGLMACIERTQGFLGKNPHSFVWRADIRKFFASIDQETLLRVLSRRVQEQKARWLIGEIVRSFSQRERAFRGMPIGNLTSQIFANIYLNELDRFVKHELKVKYYLRYGDDCILIHPDLEKLKQLRARAIRFIQVELGLKVNPKNDKILKAGHGLKFLGVEIWPTGRKLNMRNINKIQRKLCHRNISSYFGLMIKHSNRKAINEFCWLVRGHLSKN
jgi:retron-type reverse transcriptase